MINEIEYLAIMLRVPVVHDLNGVHMSLNKNDYNLSEDIELYNVRVDKILDL